MITNKREDMNCKGVPYAFESESRVEQVTDFWNAVDQTLNKASDNLK